MTEIDGYVGQTLTPTEIEQAAIHPIDRHLISDEHAIALNQSPTPAKIDKWLRRLTRGTIGYSIELADTPIVLVDEETHQQIEPGDQASFPVRELWDGCYRLIDPDDLTDEIDG